MRRKLRLSRFVLAIAVVALAFASWNPALAAKPAKDQVIRLTVVADPGSLDVVPSANGGPFYIGGILEDPETGDQVGLFHCWGFFFQGGALGVVDQEYDLIGRGKIILTGVEDEGPRAITGGTGEFRNVRGEATGFDFSAFPVFPVEFRVIGAGD